MSEEFMEGLYDCPECGNMVSGYEWFCGMCGATLPLPPTIEDLKIRLNVSNMVSHTGLNSHNAQKVFGQKFCADCGRKL